MKEDEFPLGEMVMVPEVDWDQMEYDLDYWVTATSMLADLLVENEIDFEVNEETVAKYRGNSIEVN